MGTKNQPGAEDAYDKALPDEPMFTLLARDTSAPAMVRQWAYERERAIRIGKAPETDQPKVDEARACAAAMKTWRAANEGSDTELPAWRKPRAVVPLTLEQQSMIAMLENAIDMVIDGQLQQHTLKIHGITLTANATDVDSKRPMQLYFGTGSVFVPKGAVLAPLTQLTGGANEGSGETKH